jgi:hypothetical protein
VLRREVRGDAGGPRTPPVGRLATGSSRDGAAGQQTSQQEGYAAGRAARATRRVVRRREARFGCCRWPLGALGASPGSRDAAGGRRQAGGEAERA